MTTPSDGNSLRKQKREAPTCMRCRGLARPGCAWRTDCSAAVRRLTARRYQPPDRNSGCPVSRPFPGVAPGSVSVFGGDRISTGSVSPGTRGLPKQFQDSLAIHRTPAVIPRAGRYFHRGIHRNVHRRWNKRRPGDRERHRRRPSSAVVVVVVATPAEVAEQPLAGPGRGLGHPADRADERVRRAVP